MKLENNLDTDNILRLVIRLAVPSMLGQFVSVLYSIVDRMYIGNIPEIGAPALAGVGVCGPIVNLVGSFAFLVGIGGAPLMSIRMGQKDEKAAKKIVANCFLMLAALSVILTAFSLLFRKQLLWQFGAGESTYGYALEYITIYLVGTVFVLMTNGMNQFVINQGFAQVGMKAVVLGAAANIILDPVFIFALHWNVAGAAAATVLSQIASCVYVLTFLFGKRAPIGITFGGYDWKTMSRVLRVGFPPFLIIALDNVLIISINTMIQRCGGPGLGDKLLTCATIVQSLMLLVTMPLGGITMGTQTILGYNFGARRPDRIWRAQKCIALLCLGFTCLMFLLYELIPGCFVRIFTQNPEYADMTVDAIRIYALGIIPLALQYTIVDGFTGMGAACAALPLSLFRKAVFLAATFGIPLLGDVRGIFWAEPLSDFFGPAVSVLAYALFFRKIVGWKDA